MYILPLVIRELTVAQRRRSTYFLRIGLGAGTMAVAAWAFLVWRAAPEDAGHAVFAALAWVAVAAIVLTAVLLGSDTVSSERRTGTLGLLFLTDLQPNEIVAGTLAAAGIVPLFTLMASFPS